MTGGENRVCIIDDEVDPRPGTLRCTGDHVRRHDDGRIYYEGRTDEQCKRNGKRLNLLQLQEVWGSRIALVCSVWSWWFLPYFGSNP